MDGELIEFETNLSVVKKDWKNIQSAGKGKSVTVVAGCATFMLDANTYTSLMN